MWFWDWQQEESHPQKDWNVLISDSKAEDVGAFFGLQFSWLPYIYIFIYIFNMKEEYLVFLKAFLEKTFNLLFFNSSADAC